MTTSASPSAPPGSPRMRRRLLPSALLAALAATAVAQLPPTAADSGYLSRAGLAANQLFYQVEQLRAVLTPLRGPQVVSLLRRTDAYYEDVLAFTRLLQRAT